MTFVDEEPAKWIRLSEVDSTNTYALAGSFPSGTVILAQRQTAGRGRHGRRWDDQEGATFIFSACLELEAGAQSAMYLPFVCGCAVLAAAHRAVREFPGMGAAGQDRYCLKWPNDVWVFRRGERGKIAGVLVESEIRGSVMRVVLGIGLNWRAAPKVDKPAAPLFSGAVPDPSHFARFLVPELNIRLKELFSSGAGEILAEFRANDCTSGRHVQYAGKRYTSAGIDDEGALILVDADGRTSTIRDTLTDFELLDQLEEV